MTLRLLGDVRCWSECGLVEAPNLVVNQGRDVVGRLLAGYPDYRISHIYFEYENTAGVPAPIVPAAGDNISDVHGLVAPRDVIRAALVSQPVLGATGVGYVSNLITFFAMTASSVGLLNALPFTQAADSKVYALNLVCAPGGSDYLQDLLYARVNLATPIAVGGNGTVSATWNARVLP